MRCAKPKEDGTQEMTLLKHSCASCASCVPSLSSVAIVLALACLTGCAARVNKPVTTTGTLAELRNVRPDVKEVKVEQGLEQAMQNYRRFLDDTPQTTMTPEAMRRLADLQLEK